jgi:phosphatidylserine decarboxylase
MAKEGIPFILIFLLPAVVLFLFGWWIGAAVLVALALFMVFFFRDPERAYLDDDKLILSPADGRVVAITPVEEGTQSPIQVSIFLSPLDVHINRSPLAGEVLDVVYKPGAFHVASRDIASIENEQNVVTVRGRYATIVFRQIAGAMARRVVCWKKKGDRVRQGERVGLMKFSSRMDVVMPSEVEVAVDKGARVVAGVTVIGRVNPREAEGKDA